jgi:nucleoside-diphosphate-sugar epimerase
VDGRRSPLESLEVIAMKVLLTGHLGYIGTVLAPRLLARGHDVVGLDSDLFAACTFAGDVVELPLVGRDVREAIDDPRFHERLEGLDAIIHLAGLSNDPLGEFRPNITEEINAEASIRLAAAAKRAGVTRFIFASSCSNYGASSNLFIDETGEFNPVTAYGRSKVSVELGVGPLADETFSPTFLRASTAYGLSPRLRFDLVVNNLAAWAFTTGEVRMKSDGSPWRPIVHVEDIAAAYIAALEADRADVHNMAFNVGSTSENYQVRDIALIVGELTPGARVGFAEGASPDLRNYRVDCGLIARRLHAFKPQWTCRRGVEQLLAAFDRVGLKLEDFEGERFKRIAHIQKRIADGEIDHDLRLVSAERRVA